MVPESLILAQIFLGSLEAPPGVPPQSCFLMAFLEHLQGGALVLFARNFPDFSAERPIFPTPQSQTNLEGWSPGSRVFSMSPQVHNLQELRRSASLATKVFIQRDYSDGTICQFQTKFPPELDSRVRTSFSKLGT